MPPSPPSSELFRLFGELPRDIQNLVWQFFGRRYWAIRDGHVQIMEEFNDGSSRNYYDDRSVSEIGFDIDYDTMIVACGRFVRAACGKSLRKKESWGGIRVRFQRLLWTSHLADEKEKTFDCLIRTRRAMSEMYNAIDLEDRAIFGRHRKRRYLPDETPSAKKRTAHLCNSRIYTNRWKKPPL